MRIKITGLITLSTMLTILVMLMVTLHLLQAAY